MCGYHGPGLTIPHICCKINLFYVENFLTGVYRKQWRTFNGSNIIKFYYFYETMFFPFQALVDAKISINCDDNDIYDNHIKTDLQRLVSIKS